MFVTFFFSGRQNDMFIYFKFYTETDGPPCSGANESRKNVSK